MPGDQGSAQSRLEQEESKERDGQISQRFGGGHPFLTVLCDRYNAAHAFEWSKPRRLFYSFHGTLNVHATSIAGREVAITEDLPGFTEDLYKALDEILASKGYLEQ